MAVVIVILIGALGFMFWQNYMQPKATTDATSTPASTSTPVVSTIDDTAAATMVGEFYSKYYDSIKIYLNSANPDKTEVNSLVSQYGTTNFVKTYNETTMYDPVLCVQALNDSRPTVTSHKLVGDTASVTVQTKWGTASAPTYNVMDVSVANQSGLKIDSVTCPAN